jgi:HK97 family phage portal protein
LARKFRLFPKSKLVERIEELETKLRLSDNWDLKGTTLIDLINEYNGGKDVTQKNAMKFTAVLAAVSIRSQLLASFPKGIFRNTNQGKEPLYDHPLYRLLAYSPNPYMNAYTFWETVNVHLDLWGNAYVFISRKAGKPINLMPVDPSNISLQTDGDLLYKVENTGDGVLDGVHSPDKFLHFKDISFNGLLGMSRIALANTSISLGLSAENFGKEFFDKGGHSKGVIEMDGQLGEDAFRNFKKRWDENANHGTPLLDGGKKYKQLTIPMEDAQFIATRDFQIQDIARIFNVPPTLLGQAMSSNYNSAEAMDLSFLKYGLRPMVKRYEAELEGKLLGEDLGKISIRFNMDGILRGDTAARSNYYSIMKTNKIMTTNEIRALEGMNPIDGGDVLENPATSTNKENEQD